MKLFGGGYFTIIRIEENYIEMVSNNTRHQWIIFKRSIDSNKPVTLYHKHTADTKYYHKHWETWTVAMVVESISPRGGLNDFHVIMGILTGYRG